MVLIETLFSSFFNIVLFVLNSSVWLCYLLLAAFVMAFVAGLVYACYHHLGGL